MIDSVAKTLERLALTLNGLPANAQADVLAEIENRVDNLTRPQMTEDQRAIVRQRLAEPRRYANSEDVVALLRRFNPAR